MASKAGENLINSRLKMFQNASSSSKPPPLPVKPKITADQAISAAKFAKNNVKVSHIKAALEIGAELNEFQQQRPSKSFSKNQHPENNNNIDPGKVLATAKFLQSTQSNLNQQSKPLPKPPPTLPTIVRKTSTPVVGNSEGFSSSINVRELSSKLQQAQHQTPPTIVPPHNSSRPNDLPVKSVKELSSKLRDQNPTIVRSESRPKSTNENFNSVKALRADLENKLSFGPPTIVHANRRSSGQDSNLRNSVSYSSNFDDDNYTSYPRMLPTSSSSPTRNLPSPTRPAPPKLHSPQPTTSSVDNREPYGIMLYDFDGQHSDELSCRAGERVIIKQNVDDDWIYAFNPRTQCVGIVPTAYVSVKLTSPPSAYEHPKSPTAISNKNELWDDDSGVDSAHDGPRCYTLHDFNSGEPGDLAFCQGEIIRLLCRINADWLEGEAHDGRRGNFPASFVEIIEDLPSTDNSPRTPSDFVSNEPKQQKINDSKISTKPRLVVALYDFYGENEGDLSFAAGEEIEVTNVINDDWLAGCTLSNGQSVSFGIFPASFVDYLPTHEITKNQNTANVSSSDTHNQNSLVGKIVVALYDYKSDQPSDLSFEAGDEIEITNVIDDDWMEGRLMVGLSNKRCWPVGLFPRNFVNFLS